MKTKSFILALSAAVLAASAAHAQVIYGTVNSTYSQNFNWTTNGTQSVTWTDNSPTQPFTGNWTGNSTGWYAGSSTQSSSSIEKTNGAGTNNPGLTIYNMYFNSSDTDRSFGGRPTGTTPMSIALRLTNNTGITLTQFTLGYRLETTQWRANGNHTTAAVSYYIGSNTTSWRDGTGYTATPALNLTSVYGGDTATAVNNVNGNASGNFTSINGTVTGISWADGTDLWIRWHFATGTNLPNVGIDDVTFSAIPEPSTVALLAGSITTTLLILRRRNRHS